MRATFGMKGTGTGTCALYLVTPFSATNLQSYGGTIALTFYNTWTKGSASAVQFGSKIYHKFFNIIYEYDTITGANTTFRTIPDHILNTGAAEWFHSLFITNISGTWYMLTIYPTTGSQIKGDKYNFTTATWSTGASVHGFGDPNTPSFRYQFGSDIYWHINTSDDLNLAPTTYKWAISTNTGSSFTGPDSTSVNSLSLLSYMGNIYALGHLSTSAPNSLRLFQLVGGAWQLVKTINSPGPGTAQSATQMFTDGTYMYAICYYATSGWRMWQIDSGLNSTEISSSVFPSYLLTNTGLTNEACFKGVHVDSHTDPTNPEIWLTYTSLSRTVGAGLSWFKWQGPAAQLHYAGDSGEGGPDYNISYSTDGGGQYVFSPGEPNIQIDGSITASSTSPGNVDIPFRVYQSNNVPVNNLVDVNLYYATTPHPPRELGRLTNITPSGIIVNDYTVRVAANSGTLWNVEWRAAADAVPVGDRVSLTLYTNKVL